MEKKIGYKGSEGLPEKVYRFITKEELQKDTLLYSPMLIIAPGTEKGDGKNIMAFLFMHEGIKEE